MHVKGLYVCKYLLDLIGFNADEPKYHFVKLHFLGIFAFILAFFFKHSNLTIMNLFHFTWKYAQHESHKFVYLILDKFSNNS